jgi:SH3 domain-containing YSC84-like protein 1
MSENPKGVIYMLARLTLVLLVSATVALAADDAVERIGDAKAVFDEIMKSPDKGIPRDLIAKAHCIVIVPAVKRGGFIVGAQYGKGVATCRQPQGAGWTGVSTVRMEGGSIGLQIGGGETDVVMMVMNETGANKLMKSEFTLGGEGAAMAGPVGRSATAETDAYLRAEILSYSRSRGLFAGLVLKGATLRSDDKDNASLYGKSVTHEDILKGRIPATPSASALLSTLSGYSTVEASAR